MFDKKDKNRCSLLISYLKFFSKITIRDTGKAFINNITSFKFKNF